MAELDTAMAQTANTAPVTPAVTPAPTTPAAPATPAPRPASMEEAFAQAKVPSDTPPDETAGDPREIVTEPIAPTAPAPDPIAEARTAAVTETETRLKAQLEQELEPLRPVMPLAHAIAQDVQQGSVANLHRLMQEYAAHPVLGPKIRSMLGSMLGRRPQTAPQAPPAPEPEPQPDLQFADGTPTYSPEQHRKLLAWRDRQLQAQIDKKYAPLLQLHQRVQRVDQQHQMAQRAVDVSTRTVQAWADQPHFKENAAAIAAEQQKLFDQGMTDPALSLGKAYAIVLTRDVFPKLRQQQQTDLVASATAKAIGRTDNPSAAAPAPPRRPKTMEESFRQHGLGS